VQPVFIKRENRITISSFAIAIVAGCLIQVANPMLIIILAIIYFAAVFFSFVVVVIGIFSKKFRVWYLIGLVPLLTALSVLAIARNVNHKKAEKVVSQIEIYRESTGRYPTDLKQIGNTFEIKGIEYYFDSTNSSYRIEYPTDNVNREYFDSANNEWGTLGWND
jgi:ABC-type multidrug transport system permease subunit